MKASSQLVFADKLTTLLEPASDLIAFRQIIDLIAACGMRLDRENLAVHPEGTDAVVGAELEGSEQGVCVLHAEKAQLCQGVGPFHLADGSSRRREELDRLISKQTTETEANHGLLQFIVM